jgi:hypothetical protein
MQTARGKSQKTFPFASMSAIFLKRWLYSRTSEAPQHRPHHMEKEVTACMEKRTAVLLAVLFLVGYGVMHMIPFWFGSRLIIFDMDMPHYGGPFAGHRHFAFYQGPAGMMAPHVWMMFGILVFLFHLSLLVIGWVWWKTAGSFKWLGLALMAWGLIGLLPKWALIALAFVAAYLLKKRQQQQTSSIGSWPTPSIQAAHILDEWEKNIKKEDS